jgi:hypothetical protein
MANAALGMAGVVSQNVSCTTPNGQQCLACMCELCACSCRTADHLLTIDDDCCCNASDYKAQANLHNSLRKPAPAWHLDFNANAASKLSGQHESHMVLQPAQFMTQVAIVSVPTVLMVALLPAGDSSLLGV